MEFEKYLETNNLVPENKIKYFSNWADKFLHGINYKVAAIDQNSIIAFITTLPEFIPVPLRTSGCLCERKSPV